MPKYFEIDGYWTDTGETFENYIVSETCDVDPNDDDDRVFFYGLSAYQLRKAIESKEPFGDWVCTAFREIGECWLDDCMRIPCNNTKEEGLDA